MYVLYDEFMCILFEGTKEECEKRRKEFLEVTSEYNDCVGTYYIEKLIDFLGDLPKWGDWL